MKWEENTASARIWEAHSEKFGGEADVVESQSIPTMVSDRNKGHPGQAEKDQVRLDSRFTSGDRSRQELGVAAGPEHVGNPAHVVGLPGQELSDRSDHSPENPRFQRRTGGPSPARRRMTELDLRQLRGEEVKRPSGQAQGRAR